MQPIKKGYRISPNMQKVTFVTSYQGRLTGYIAGVPYFLVDKGSDAKVGETWLIEITKINANRTAVYIRAIRPWRGTPEDCRSIFHPHVDFRSGVVKLLNHYNFPIEHTLYAQLWGDYKLLSKNTNSVIIRGDKAIRWNSKGKPPHVVPLNRFATKYKNQPLLGTSKDIHYFSTNLEEFRNMAIEYARKRNT